MITDLFDGGLSRHLVDFINKWSTLISIHRHLKKRDGPDSANDWMNRTVYEGLTNDELTRYGASEFRAKSAKVNAWWAAHLLNGNDYNYAENQSLAEESASEHYVYSSDQYDSDDNE